MATKRAVYNIAEFKAVPNGAPGEFTALVSVFGNVDLQGDRVMPGAFDNTIAQWKASGDPIPIIWSHDWQDPFAHIGLVTGVQITTAGLVLSGKNDIDKPFAKQVNDLLVARRVTQWSFAYDVINEQRAKDGANELLELALIEAGPTLMGANSSTNTIAAKALLSAAADLERGLPHGLPGRKTWVDADMGGTFEDISDRIGDAATALLNPANLETTYVSVQATYPTYALVEVYRQGVEDDVTYQIPWSLDGEEVKLGDPVQVEVTVTVAPKSASKMGRRLSQATQTEMKAIHDGMGALQDRMGALMGVATEDDDSKSGRKAVSGAVPVHHTATTDEAWDGPANNTNVVSPLTVAKASDIYAWIDRSKVEDGELAKSNAKFIHHEVSADGTPGAANLTACSTGIGVLNGGQSGTTIPDADIEGVYAHLAAHLKDAAKEPPPLKAIEAPTTDTDREPPAKSVQSVEAFLTRVSEMRALTGIPA